MANGKVTMLDVYELAEKIEEKMDHRFDAMEDKLDKRFEKLEIRTSVLERFNDKILGGAITLSIVWGIAVLIVQNLISKIKINLP